MIILFHPYFSGSSKLEEKSPEIRAEFYLIIVGLRYVSGRLASFTSFLLLKKMQTASVKRPTPFYDVQAQNAAHRKKTKN